MHRMNVTEDMTERIGKRRLKRFVHLTRMTERRPEPIAVVWEPEDRCRSPRTKWKELVMEEIPGKRLQEDEPGLT